jgi:hypothetical protein
MPYRFFFRHAVSLGRKTFFHSRHGWFCSRLIPARHREVDRSGFMLDGVPLMLQRWRYVEKGRRYAGASVNLFDRPPDFRQFVPRLLALVPKRGHVVVNYPAEWQYQFRAASRAGIPRLKKNCGYWPSTWRIYGKELT